MVKKETKVCSDCGKEMLRYYLSNQGLCYDCGKKRMLKAFDVAWMVKHKKGVMLSERKEQPKAG